MDASQSPLDRLIPLVGSSLGGGRQGEVARLGDCSASAAEVRARRCEAGLPAPPLAFLSLTSPSAFARCNCATSLHGWSIDLPRPLLNRVLFEMEKAGVFFCALTGRGRWLDDDLFDVMRVHDRLVFLLCVQPDELGRSAESLSRLPHVLPLLVTRNAGSGCCDGCAAPAARAAIDALRSRRIPYGFAVTAGEGSLSHMMGLGFFNECLQEHATFGLVVDCLQIPSCDDSCRPVRPAEREALGRHIAGLRDRLGGFFAYFPWDLADSGWCLAAPHQLDDGPAHGTAFTLLHVAPSHYGERDLAPPGALLFESLRISPMGEARRCTTAAGRLHSARPVTPAASPA